MKARREEISDLRLVLLLGVALVLGVGVGQIILWAWFR